MKTNLPHIAAKVRIDALEMIYGAQSGHPGSSFSCTDILVSLYCGGFLKCDAKNPKWEGRDYFILSKGHAAPALYGVLGELDFFSKDEFFRLRQVDSLLQGHPERFIPGVEIASGPLGQGLSVATGAAMALKIDGKQNKVFSLHGDGELQEGNIWEAVMTASKYKVDNLVAIIDRNQLQIDGFTRDVCPVGDIAQEFASFGWEVLVMNGHDFDNIKQVLSEAVEVVGKPCVVIANTVKGKGVSFMENQAGWHGKAPNDEQFEQAMEELQDIFEATK